MKGFVKNDNSFVIVVKNINERKNYEYNLKLAKNKAEESDKLKTAFLSNMSHEIRTPLNAIFGFSGMLNKPGLSNEKLKSFVSIIQNSSQQLLSIVNDVLTISLIETKCIFLRAYIDFIKLGSPMLFRSISSSKILPS